MRRGRARVLVANAAIPGSQYRCGLDCATSMPESDVVRARLLRHLLKPFDLPTKPCFYERLRLQPNGSPSSPPQFGFTWATTSERHDLEPPHAECVETLRAASLVKRGKGGQKRSLAQVWGERVVLGSGVVRAKQHDCCFPTALVNDLYETTETGSWGDACVR